jgi:hypothetical protein
MRGDLPDSSAATALNRRPPERERAHPRRGRRGWRAAVAGSGRPGRAAEMVSRSGPSVAAGRERGVGGRAAGGQDSGPVRKIVCGSVSKILFGTVFFFYLRSIINV